MSCNPDQRQGARRLGIAHLAWLLLAICIGLGPPLAHAASEDELKAAFSINIARFTSWPVAEPAMALRLCVLNDDAILSAAEALAGKVMGDRKLAVFNVERETDLAGCHMLYIGSSESLRMSYVLSLLKQASSARPVLTISDMPDFIERGGMVQLLREGDRIRFMISPTTISRAGLNMSSKLMQLAIIKD